VNIIALLLAGFLGRLMLSPFGTLNLDQGTFIAWSNMLTQGGLQSFYSSWSDYLPGYLYILWILGHVAQALQVWSPVLYKLPAILVDIATGFLIYKIVLGIKNKKIALLAAGAYVFNPAILANSTLWGQVDTFTAFFSLLAVYLSRKNIYFSAIALAIGTLIKPQAALAGLPILFVFLKLKKKPVDYLSYAILGLITFSVGFLPFTTLSNLPTFILERLTATTSQYPYTSINAFNFWGLWDFWQPDSTGSQLFGFLAIIVMFTIAAYKLWNQKHAEYPLLAVSLLTGFLFMTRLHERHLLPALAPVLVTGVIYPLAVISYCILSGIYLLNLRYAFIWINEDFRSIFAPSLVKAMILANVASLGLFFVSLFRKGVAWGKIFAQFSKRLPEEKQITFTDTTTGKRGKVFLYIILAFAFTSRLLFLESPKNEYFDEVYHAFTARTMLHEDAKAWEWWNPNPEGFAYEWTHPPLAKLGMVAGMSILGENPLGWRIPGAILGTVSVFLLYLIAKVLFKSRDLGLLAAGVFALDGLPLVSSRIGMNDTYFLFFILLCFYLFLKDKHAFASLALGLAAASKWSTMWFLPILVVAFFALRKKISWQVLLYAFVPPLIYLASYIPFFTSGHTVDQFIELQKQMWWYHTGLKAEHAYSSPWWSWPLLIRPIWLYVNYTTEATIANIYAMGNPAVFWFGTASVILSIYEAFTQRSKKLGLILFAFFAFFASWALSPRIMFMYHFLPSVPFMAIAIAYILKRNQKLIIPFFVISGVLFIYFFPHWTGIEIPKWLDSSYYWLPSWK
jgi:dolichyl-phosphate-mannose-protein mannosyltransferase